MVVVPNCCSLWHYRSNRLEWLILVQPEPLRKHTVPYTVHLGRVPRSPSLGFVTMVMLTVRVKQSFNDHHGTNIPYRSQLYHLGKNYKAAGTLIPLPESKILCVTFPQKSTSGLVLSTFPHVDSIFFFACVSTLLL